MNRRQALKTGAAVAVTATLGFPASAALADPVAALGIEWEEHEAEARVAYDEQDEAEGSLWVDGPHYMSPLMDCGGIHTSSEWEARQYGNPTEDDIRAIHRHNAAYARARKLSGMEPFAGAAVQLRRLQGMIGDLRPCPHSPINMADPYRLLASALAAIEDR